jgi:hypothetical protein
LDRLFISRQQQISYHKVSTKADADQVSSMVMNRREQSKMRRSWNAPARELITEVPSIRPEWGMKRPNTRDRDFTNSGLISNKSNHLSCMSPTFTTQILPQQRSKTPITAKRNFQGVLASGKYYLDRR